MTRLESIRDTGTGAMGGRDYTATVITSFGAPADIRFQQPTGDHGPVFLVLHDGTTVRVDKPVNDRCGGILSPEWIERFYA